MDDAQLFQTSPEIADLDKKLNCLSRASFKGVEGLALLDPLNGTRVTGFAGSESESLISGDSVGNRDSAFWKKEVASSVVLRGQLLRTRTKF
jgi:hypothetical protein